MRKYDDGRFLSIDPLWEKYLAWSPYHYCGNNPVNATDGNGMYYKVVQYNEGKVPFRIPEPMQQALFYQNYSNLTPTTDYDHLGLEQRLNSLISNWQEKAPAIASYANNNTLFTGLVAFEESKGGSSYGGNCFVLNRSVFDDNNKYHRFGVTAFHETVHLMGHAEFQAWATTAYMGFTSKDDMKEQFKTQYSYIIEGMPKELQQKHLRGRKVVDFNGLYNAMVEIGKQIATGGK